MCRIRIVFFDADETLWTMHKKGHASLLRPPYTRVDLRSMVDSDGRVLTMHKDAFRLLDVLANKGIYMSLLSANDEDKVLLVLEHFGISKYFHYPQITWDDRELGTCDKAALLERALGLFREELGICFRYNEILFVDDRIANISRVQSLGVRCLHFRHFDDSLFFVTDNL